MRERLIEGGRMIEYSPEVPRPLELDLGYIVSHTVYFIYASQLTMREHDEVVTMNIYWLRL